MSEPALVASSPLLRRPGAVAADPPDQGVASHYGDPFVEQRELSWGNGSVDLSNRGVVRVAGPDRLSWLHSLTTQHLTDLEPKASAQALILSPHGHIEHDLHIVDDGETCWITVEPGTAPALVAFLDSMRFMLRVEVEDVTERWGVLWIPTDVAQPPGLVNPWSPPRDIEGHADFAGREWMVRRISLDPMADLLAAGAPLAGMWAYEALRIAAHVPRLGFETDHRTIPHEIGLLEGAVHLNKGCYRGQETVARVHNLGRPPRRLVFLHLDGSDSALPAHGDDIVLDDRTVGFVGSAARHYELGPIALGVVKRNTPRDVGLLAGGIPANAEVVVDA